MLIYSVCITAVAVLAIAACLFLLFKSGLYKKLLGKIGIRVTSKTPNWALFSWGSMLEKLDYTPDIVFFGDSITRGGNFHLAFPSKKIVNLGYSGDTLRGMSNRVSMVKALSPKKIFLLGGINGLKKANKHTCIKEYTTLLDRLHAAIPEATVYVQSLLPVSRSKERRMCPNATIRKFNEALRTLAQERGCPFIDLYPLYEKQGELDPTLTVDGIHLHEKAYTEWEKAIAPFVLSDSAKL